MTSYRLKRHRKRFHGASHFALVPFIGAIWLIVELGILEGTRGANQYGPDPLGG